MASPASFPALAAEDAASEDALPALPRRPVMRKTARAARGSDGVIHLSDGRAIGGKVALTAGKRYFELFDTTRKKWIHAALSRIRTIEFSIEKETVEREWRWKESGKDEKVYTGKTYVDRRYRVALTMSRAGKRYEGHVLGTVIYVTDEKGVRHRYFLRKDQRGGPGELPGKLVYVKQVDLRPGALEKHRRAQAERKAKAAAKSPPAPKAPKPLKDSDVRDGI